MKFVIDRLAFKTFITRVFKKIDRVIFSNLFSGFIDATMLKKHLNEFQHNNDYHFTIYYQKSDHSILSALCDKYGSDKGEIKTTGHPYLWASHTYADYYSRLFDLCRNEIKYVFECGIGTNNTNIFSSMGINGVPGASLRVWKDYFPCAEIIGVDIDKDILFEEPRITTFYVDQTDKISIKEMWDKVEIDSFDFMLDDGLHTFEASCCMFENSISRLSSKGIYIIEDASISDILKYQQYFKNKEYQVDYIIFHRPGSSVNSNILVVIRKR